jgi:hypothetical protein
MSRSTAGSICITSMPGIGTALEALDMVLRAGWRRHRPYREETMPVIDMKDL